MRGTPPKSIATPSLSPRGTRHVDGVYSFREMEAVHYEDERRTGLGDSVCLRPDGGYSRLNNIVFYTRLLRI